MNGSIKVTEKVHYLGVNDRRTHLFENMWPIDFGVSYNSYLINDEKTALIDTVELGHMDDYVERIEAILGEKTLDYLVINHMEPDHSGAIKSVVERYPNVKLVGNKKTFKIVRAYWGMDDNTLEVADGDTLELGSHTLKFVMTPWVHWPETMMTYEVNNKMLFSGDAFGTFGALDGGIFDDEINFDFYESEMRRYYSNIVGKYCNMVQKAFKKLDGVEVNYICPTHGPIWRSNPSKVLELYDKWSRYETEEGVLIVYGSMYGNTAQMADAIARGVAEGGVKNIRVFDASKTHLSHLINEVWKYKGVIVGSCAYNSDMLPTVARFTREMEHMDVKAHKLGVFGSYSWNGGGVKSIMKFADAIDWELVDAPVEVHGMPKAEDFEACKALGLKMAEQLKN